MALIGWRLFAPIAIVNYIWVNPGQPQISTVNFIYNFIVRGRASHKLKILVLLIVIRFTSVLSVHAVAPHAL